MKAILVVVLLALPTIAAVLAAPTLLTNASPAQTALAAVEPDAAQIDLAPGSSLSLGLGQSAFWDGPHVDEAGTTADPATMPLLCDGPLATMWTCFVATLDMQGIAGEPVYCEQGWCVDYQVEVLEPGGTLRIGLDHPEWEDVFELAVTPPGGIPGDITYRRSGATGCCFFSYEVRVPDAPVGTYDVHIVLHNVLDSGFRMRAFLMPPAEELAEPTLLYPNLRMIPPFQLGIAGCQVTERIEYGAQRCLRFSLGPANVGAGLLDLRIRGSGLEGPEIQRIHASDGTWEDVPAGAYEYHAAHGHYHHRAMGGVELLRVVDENMGELAPQAESPKIGFCMVDALLAQWDSFDQAEPPFLGNGGADGACGRGLVAPADLSSVHDEPMFKLTAGWSDIYAWLNEGNFVDLGDAPDDLYVLRATSDAGATITESDETDNVSYVLFRLQGDAVEVLERGYGASPWDAAKEIADDTRPPLA